MTQRKRDLRQNRRVSVEMSVEYLVVDGVGPLATHHSSKTTNISVAGLAFGSPLNIPIDSRLHLEVTLPGGGGELKCDGIVMRIVRELPGGRGLEYGVQFDMDTVKNPERLIDYVKAIDIVPLLEAMLNQRATDLHLTADTPPMFRINRRLVPADKKALTPALVEALVLGTLSSVKREELQREREAYFPFMIPGLGRWRGCVFYQRGNIEATFHTIDMYIPTVNELGLPDVVSSLAASEGGLICVTGGSGSGKSTTVAALIKGINQEREKVIVTLENPIQYIHENIRGIVKQREVGSDAVSTTEGLRNILRHDPDVIAVDDIHDHEVMDMALRAAENGCLVIASFPTPDPMATIRRIVGMYPPDRRGAILHTLSTTLRGMICQRLVPTVDNRELVLVPEILTMSDGIRQAIWTSKIEQIPNLMMSTPGSITLDASLRRLMLRGLLDFERASVIARDPDSLRRNVAV